MGKGMTKAERLDRMKLLYCERAFSDAEMGERLGCDRSTIYRDRIELERQHPFVAESLSGCAARLAADALCPREHR